MGSVLGQFLVAPKRLYKSACPSVGPSVRRSVCHAFVTLSLFGLLGATYGRVSGLVQQYYVRSIITSKRIELASPGWSGFEENL